MSIESRIWSLASRAETALVAWIKRSASVDLPWSMWAMMEKLRICCMGWVKTKGHCEGPLLCLAWPGSEELDFSRFSLLLRHRHRPAGVEQRLSDFCAIEFVMTQLL